MIHSPQHIMTARSYIKCLLGPASAILALLLPQYLSAQSVTQNITLVPGWNSIWLEVSPVHTAGNNEGYPKSPADIFGSDARVKTVLSPKPLAGTAEFFAENPDNVTTSFNRDEWEQWSNPTQPGDNLTIITGNRAYLIEATAPTTISIEGKVRFNPPTWAPDRYNLMGFGLAGTPTFQEFFEAAGSSHPTNLIYRLIPSTGNWVKVSNPATETMNSNESYWIFSSGPSTYMGPVAVDFDNSVAGFLQFGGPDDVRAIGTGANTLYLDLEEIAFTNLNNSAPAATPSLDLIASDDDSGSFTLRSVTPDPDNLGYVAGNLIDTSLGATTNPSSLDESVEPQTTAVLSLGAARNWESGSVGRTNVYRLSTGAGSAFWLPVKASLNSVELSTDTLPGGTAAVAGLWVGEISGMGS